MHLHTHACMYTGAKCCRYCNLMLHIFSLRVTNCAATKMESLVECRVAPAMRSGFYCGWVVVNVFLACGTVEEWQWHHLKLRARAGGNTAMMACTVEQWSHTCAAAVIYSVEWLWASSLKFFRTSQNQLCSQGLPQVRLLLCPRHAWRRSLPAVGPSCGGDRVSLWNRRSRYQWVEYTCRTCIRVKRRDLMS